MPGESIFTHIRQAVSGKKDTYDTQLFYHEVQIVRLIAMQGSSIVIVGSLNEDANHINRLFYLQRDLLRLYN